MKVKNIAKNKLIQLDANPKSSYAIITLVLFIFLFVLCAGIAYYFQDKIITALAILFIPIAVIIFLLKVVIWNFFGQETILIKKDSIETSLYYNYIYKAQFHSYNHPTFTLLFRSNISTNLISPAEITATEFTKAKFKIHMKFDDGKYYQSAFSINQKEAIELVESI